MLVLLDIDGVLVTTPTWRAVESEADGFMKFNEMATKNLAYIIDITNASIVLTTTHRINYSIEEWKSLLAFRGITPASIEKINDVVALEAMRDRATEIEEWVARIGHKQNYVIIDDDLSINRLPEVIKRRFIQTMPMIGLDETATFKALTVLSKEAG